MINRKSNLYKLTRNVTVRDKDYDPTLTNEELVKLYQETRDEHFFECLLYNNFGLIINIVKGLKNKYSYTEDEILSICLDAFFKATLAFNKGALFSTYFYNAIMVNLKTDRALYLGGGKRSVGRAVMIYNFLSFSNTGIKACRNDHEDFEEIFERMIKEGYLNENTKIHDGLLNALNINYDRSVNPYNVSEDEIFDECEISAQYKYIVDNMERFKKVLSDKDFYVLNCYFGLNGEAPKTLTELASIAGTSVQAVAQRKDRALRKIRELIEDDATFEGDTVRKRRIFNNTNQ